MADSLLSSQSTDLPAKSIPVSSISLQAGPPAEEILIEGTSTLPNRHVSFYLSFLALCLSAFIAAVDTVILANALPIITTDLHATTLRAYWCGTGFLIAQTVFQPLCGSLSYYIKSKTLMQFSLIVFAIASLFCATAQSLTWLVIARVFQGIGAGGMNALVNIIISDMVVIQERGKYFGLMTLATAVGLVSGVILGAVIAERSTWRLIFYINLPVCVISLAGITLFLPGNHLEKPSWSQFLKRFDWLGTCVLSASLSSMLFAITAGGVLYPWRSANSLVPLLLGILGMISFCIYEAVTAREPLIPLRIFASRTAVAAFFSAWVFGLVLWGISYYLILYFLIAKNHSLLHSSLETLPGIAIVAPSAAVAGFVIAITGRVQKLMWTGWTLVTVGLGLLSTLTSTTSSGPQYGYQVLIAVGGGVIFPAKVFAAQAAQVEKDVAVATAIVAFLTSLGQACGVATGGAAFQNSWNHYIREQIIAGTIPEQYFISANAIIQEYAILNSLPDSVQIVYRGMMAKSIGRGIWITLTAFAAAAFVISLLAKNLHLGNEVKKEE
ncbi:drug resistance transporter [Xylogone sp. PMI_703]|nr:drug resistance transporter [Xylogone sp. PMI_703]